MLIGPKFFAANTIRRFQQSRDNQFWVSVWPTPDLKNAFFRADDDFFFGVFLIFLNFRCLPHSLDRIHYKNKLEEVQIVYILIQSRCNIELSDLQGGSKSGHFRIF